MSDKIFFLNMTNEGCFTFIIHCFVQFMNQINEYLMKECEKGCHKAWAAVKTKMSIFNLQYLSHLCIDFYATNRSAVKRYF